MCVLCSLMFGIFVIFFVEMISSRDDVLVKSFVLCLLEGCGEEEVFVRSEFGEW